MAFAYWLQWKLGMLEAIIFVMVIGMSVDYVVHMSDAYLQSVHTDRAGRSRFMLGKMGMSIEWCCYNSGSSFLYDVCLHHIFL